MNFKSRRFCCILGIHPKPRGRSSSAMRSSRAAHSGRKGGAAYSLVAEPRLSALAPAADEDSTHLHQRRENLVPADSDFIFRVLLDEEITEDFFSLNVFPPLRPSQDRFWILTGQDVKGEATLLLPVSSCPDVTARGARTRRAAAAGEPQSRCVRTRHLRLKSSRQFDSRVPEASRPAQR